MCRLTAGILVTGMLLTRPGYGQGFNHNCTQTPGSSGYVNINAPNIVRLGEAFEETISLCPPSAQRVSIEMPSTSSVHYVPEKFVLNPRESRSVKVTVDKTPWGVAWTYAHVSEEAHYKGIHYRDSYNTIVVSFEGQLKLSSMPRLPFESPTTLTFTILDANDKPIPFDTSLVLTVESTDAVLSVGNGYNNRVDLTIEPRAQISRQFQIKPKSYRGGQVHLNGVLRIGEYNPTVLTSASFHLESEPAWWLPVSLALLGGILHGIYTITRSARRPRSGPVAILAASGVAGFVGYLVANLDILGLKLDPSILRTYPLAGFLCSYFGFDVLLPRPTQSEREAHDTKSARHGEEKVQGGEDQVPPK